MKQRLTILLLFAALAGHCAAGRITVEFEAVARTVVGTPFGAPVPLDTQVRGYFAYETDTPDTVADPMVGDFRHAGTSEFCAEFLDFTVTGSGDAVGGTNLFGSPTFRLFDGAGHPFAGDMRVNGEISESAAFTFAISGTAEDLPTDSMPDPFRFGGAPTTFSISDASGTLLLRATRLREFAPAPVAIAKRGDVVEIEFRSVKDRVFEIWFGTDLTGWTRIAGAHPSAGLRTTYTDDLAARHEGGAIPEAGFYRIAERTGGG